MYMTFRVQVSDIMVIVFDVPLNPPKHTKASFLFVFQRYLAWNLPLPPTFRQLTFMPSVGISPKLVSSTSHLDVETLRITRGVENKQGTWVIQHDVY